MPCWTSNFFTNARSLRSHHSSSKKKYHYFSLLFFYFLFFSLRRTWWDPQILVISVEETLEGPWTEFTSLFKMILIEVRPLAEIRKLSLIFMNSNNKVNRWTSWTWVGFWKELPRWERSVFISVHSRGKNNVASLHFPTYEMSGVHKTGRVCSRKRNLVL